MYLVHFRKGVYEKEGHQLNLLNFEVQNQCTDHYLFNLHYII